jgi:tRNA(Arg) A34 adenosine deaminase TadA
MCSGPEARQDRGVAPFRIVLLATICAAIMCCAGAVQVLGINRIVVTDGSIDAAGSVSDRAALELERESFRRER